MTNQFNPQAIELEQFLRDEGAAVLAMGDDLAHPVAVLKVKLLVVKLAEMTGRKPVDIESDLTNHFWKGVAAKAIH